jgi:peptidoglycan/xylan/chitin deacetylase (PgdA/CDA1 family)
MANGMANILWDVDTSDYAAASADEILSQIQSTTSGSILVMHDGPENRQATVDALPVMIENLKADGYELVSVTELLGQEFIPAPR